MGPGRGVVSRLCHWTKSQLTNMPVAPESKRVEAVIGQREVIGQRLTVRLRERGEFLERT